MQENETLDDEMSFKIVIYICIFLRKKNRKYNFHETNFNNKIQSNSSTNFNG